MPTRSYRKISCAFAVLAVAGVMAPLASAKNKKPKIDPQDQIEVVSHIALAGAPVTRFVVTQHYSSLYLYAEHESGKNITLIDVTKSSAPAVLAEVASAPEGGFGNLSAVAGTAALVSSQPAASSPATPPQSIKIMDLSDPKNPKIAREFTGVTALAKDNGRGLIFLANGEGIWVLQQHLAEDPQVEKAYEDYVLYGSSMYPPNR